MPTPTEKRALKIPANRLMARVVSGKNPDGSDLLVKVQPNIAGTRPSFKDAKAIPANRLMAILITGTLPTGEEWSMKTQ